jgi:hypothetical protein
MVKATNTFTFDRTDRKLRSSMRTTRPHEIGRTAFAAIKRKVFTHDSNRQRLADRKLMGATNRLPEHAQIAPR